MVVGYCRVSTDEQARSGLGLAAQRERISREAERRGWPVQWATDEGYSAKDLHRPAIQTTLAALADTGGVLMVAKLDRLSRSLHDFAGLMERARREGWSVVALDLGVDTTTPSGEMMASVMAAFAQYERRLIGQRTADALAELKRRGVRVGRPVELADETRRRVVSLRASGLTLQVVADRLNREHVPTARGGRWHASTVRAVCRSVALDRELAAARAATANA